MNYFDLHDLTFINFKFYQNRGPQVKIEMGTLNNFFFAIDHS